MLKRVLALLLAAVLLAALIPSALADGTIMYVNTRPGRRLNVRSSPQALDGVYSNVIAELYCVDPREVLQDLRQSIGWLKEQGIG